MKILIEDLKWESDANGDELGYEDCEIVSVFTSEKIGVEVRMNFQTSEVLEIRLISEGEWS